MRNLILSALVVLGTSLASKAQSQTLVTIDFNGTTIPLNSYVSFPSSHLEDGFVLTASTPTNASNIPYNGVLASGNTYPYTGIDNSNFLACGWNTYWLIRQDGGLFNFNSLQANLSNNGFLMRVWSYSDINHTQNRAEVGVFFPWEGDHLAYGQTRTFIPSQSADAIRCLELIPESYGITPNAGVVTGLGIDNIVVTIPEPSSLSLLALGGILVVLRRKRR
jgi:hypothetical protein